MGFHGAGALRNSVLYNLYHDEPIRTQLLIKIKHLWHKHIVASQKKQIGRVR